jgi:DNA repair exonuclease SbcCD ATPase subunit
MTDDLDKMILGLVDRIKLLESKLEEKQADSIKTQNQLQHANAKISQLRERLQKDKDAIYEAEILKSKVEELEGVNHKLHLELDQLHASHEQLRETKSTELMEAEKRQMEQETLQDQILLLRKQLMEKDTKVKQYETRIFELEATAASSLESENNSLNIEKVVSEYQRINTDLQDRIEELEETIKQNFVQMREGHTDGTDNQAEVEKLRDRIHISEEISNNNSVNRAVPQSVVIPPYACEEDESKSQFIADSESKHKTDAQKETSDAVQNPQQLIQRIVDLGRDKAEFEWKTAFLRVQVNYLRKERLQQQLDYRNILDQTKLENRKLSKRIESLEERNQELVQLLNDSRYGNTGPIDLLMYSSMLESRLDVALTEIEQLKIFEASMYHEITKKNMEIANLATRVHDLELLRQMEYMDYQNLQDELFYCKQNYQQEYDLLRKNAHCSNKSQSIAEESTIPRTQSIDKPALESGVLTDQPAIISPSRNFLPCQMLLQNIHVSLVQCRSVSSGEELIQELNNMEDYLGHIGLLVSAMYTDFRASSTEMAKFLMEVNKVFRDCLTKVAAQELGQDLLLPFSLPSVRKLTSIFTTDFEVQFKNDSYGTTLKDATDRAQLAEREVRLLQNRYRKTLHDSEPVMAELSSLKHQLQRASANQKDLENQLELERKEFASDIQRRELREQTLNTNLLNSTKALELATNKTQTVSEQLNQTNALNTSYLQKIIDLERTCASQLAHEAGLNDQIEVLIGEKQELHRTIDVVREDYERLNAILGEKELQIASLQKETRDVQDRLEEYEKRISNLQLQALQSDAEGHGMIQLKKKLEHVENELEAAILSRNLAVGELQTLQEALESLTNTHNAVQEQLRIIKLEKASESSPNCLNLEDLRQEMETTKIGYSQKVSLLELEISRLMSTLQTNTRKLTEDRYESLSFYDDVKYGLLDTNGEVDVSVSRSAYHFYHGGFTLTMAFMTVM